MIKYDEALQRLLERARRIEDYELIPIDECSGRVCAEDVRAMENIPFSSRSAMDGFAVISEDTFSSPVRLKVIEDVPAGKVASKRVERKTAIRIMTGAPLPEGADAVVPVEECEEEGEYVVVKVSVKKGENVSPEGEDVRKGDIIIKRGTLLNFRHIALLSACGVSMVKVKRKPKVAIITTGDEVVEIDKPLTPFTTRNVNIHSLKALVRECGADVFFAIHCRDDPGQLKEAFQKALPADVILFNAGISAGIYDIVRAFVERENVEKVFYKVAIKPGKPIYFGIYNEKPVFGLPGYPASTIVTFLRLVKPFLMKMLEVEEEISGFWAVAKEDIKLKGKRQMLVRVKVFQGENDFYFTELPPHKSNVISTIAHSSGYVIVDEPEKGIKKGERHFVYFWR